MKYYCKTNGKTAAFKFSATSNKPYDECVCLCWLLVLLLLYSNGAFFDFFIYPNTTDEEQHQQQKQIRQIPATNAASKNINEINITFWFFPFRIVFACKPMQCDAQKKSNAL